MTRLLCLYCCLLCAAVAAHAETVKEQPSQSLVAHMHEHQAYLSQIKNAVISGDLDAVREPARWLAEHPTPAEIPAGWYSHVESMRAAARAALTAIDPATAGQAVAQMAGSCGSCHDANNVYDQFAFQSEPEDAPGNVAHMLRHQWAADRMLEGLIGPSDEAWQQGSNLLLEVPLTPREMHAEKDTEKSVRAMARRVHSLGGEAAVEYDFANRVAIYGRFLGSCAACHAQTRPRPKVPVVP